MASDASIFQKQTKNGSSEVILFDIRNAMIDKCTQNLEARYTRAIREGVKVVGTEGICSVKTKYQ